MKNNHKSINKRLEKILVCCVIMFSLSLTGCDNSANSSSATKTNNTSSANNSNTTANAVPKQILPPPLATDAVVSGTLRIEPGGFDFGIIEPSSAHEVKAVIHNTGGEPITFVEVKPTCACTTTQDLTKTVIPPGESITFDAKFKAPTRPGLKEAQIRIVFKQGSRESHVRIKLQGLVTMPVRAEPPYVNAYKGVPRGETFVEAQAGESVIESIDGKPFRIITSNGKEPVYADGFNPKKDSPRNSYTIKWDIPARDIRNCAGARRWWVIETDHPDCPILPMRVRNECTGSRLDMERRSRGWYFKEYIAQLGAIEAGKPVEVDVLIPFEKPGIKFQSVQSLSQNVYAQLVSSTTNDNDTITCRVRITPREKYQGVIYAMVMFKSNVGNKDIPFIAKVVLPDSK